MKNTFRYMTAAVAILAAFSCAKQEINAPEEGSTPSGTYKYLLDVTQEGDSKTTIDGNSILWSADDQIGVMLSKDTDGSFVTAATAKEQSILDAENYTPSTRATFSLNIPEGYTPVAAAYPYVSATQLENKDANAAEDKIAARILIPEVQTGVKDGIPAGAFSMLGKIENGKCSMHNIGALIKFQITKDNIVSLKFEGNKGEYVAGGNYYYINSGEKSRDAKTYWKTSVTLIPSDTVFEPGDYYFAVSPNDLTEGFTMTLTTTDGQTSVRKTSTRFNIERNHKYTNFGSDEGWFKNVSTLAAGNLGTADGTTATLYAIVSGNDIAEGDTYGFETSSDGESWTKYDGTIERRTSVLASYNTVNVLTASKTGLVPETTSYYRAYYTTATGVTTYGKVQSFETYAKAESAIIDMYNGFDTDYWPFRNVQYDVDIRKGDSSAAVEAYKGAKFDMTTKSGYAFTAKSADGMWLGNLNGCFTMKAGVGGYIKFPVIEGKKPLCINMVIGGKNGKNQGLPAIYNFDSEEAVSSRWDGSSAAIYDSHTWNIEAAAASQYGMYFNAANNFYLSYLEVVYVNADVDTRPAEIEQNLVFSTQKGSSGTNDDKRWPFSTNQGVYDTVTSPIGPFCTTDQPDIEYYFHVSDPAASDNNWRTTAGQGLRFGGTVGDYMRFCPVADYKLTKIKIRGGNKVVVYSVTDANSQTIEGGETITASTTYDSEVSFTLTNTSPATEYRLVLGSAQPSAIREMWITYELVK